MADDRKGFFTAEQEAKLDKFIEFEGLAETLDGPTIKLTDNILLNKIKEKLQKKNPELLETVISVIDEVFENI